METKADNAVGQTGADGDNCYNWVISIIVPVYKAELTLRQCIDSVLTQTNQKFEIILIDDGSPDNSGLICDEYAKADSRIRVIHQYNQGVSAARNAGIERARGQYVLFLDSDDYLEQNALEQFADVAKIEKPDVVVGGLNFCNKQGETLQIKKPAGDGCFGADIWNLICIDSEIYGYAGGKMISQELLHQNDIFFDCKLTSQEDLAFCLDAYSAADRISTMTYAGYNYIFAPSSRKLQYDVYLRNQMNIIMRARRKENVSNEAELAVRRRICTLVYSRLYWAQKNGETYANTVSEIVRVEGLFDYLNEKVLLTKQGIIGALAGRRAFHIIRAYFAVREKVKGMLKENE